MTYNLKREGSNFTGCHYLDGVPVKISEKFRPPRKITLPLSYQQHCPVNLLTEEYDFSLENQVLELAETRRRGREAAERAKVEQLASSIEEFTRLVYSEQKPIAEETWNNCNESDHQTSPYCIGADDKNLHETQQENKDGDGNIPTSSQPNLGIASSLLNSLEPNSMLKPVPSSNEPNVSMNKPDVTLAALNLEDFEAESSPFDSMALKTLNDIEELKSVLQNASLSRSDANPAGQPAYSGHSSNDDVTTSKSSSSYVVYDCSNQVQDRPNESDKIQFTLPVLQPSCAAPIPADYPSLPTTVSHSVNFGGTATSRTTVYSCYPNLATMVAGSQEFSGALCGPPASYQTPPPSQPDAFAVHGHSIAIAHPFVAESIPNKSSPAEEIYIYGLPLRNSRSTPDLLKELGAALAAEREKKKLAPNLVQPKRPSSVGPSNPSEMEEHTSPRSVDQDGHTVIPKHSLESNQELEGNSQALVRRLSDMGFPKARVARVVEVVGQDDKKAIELLCTVQSFVERGYSPEDVEAAVLQYGHNKTQVKKYLELTLQFRDLGFEDEAIRKALAECDNDGDKALDRLVS